MDPAQLAKVTEILKRFNSGIIALQNNPSLDGIAAGTSLYLALTKMNKHVSLICQSFQKVDLLGIDKIQTEFAASGNHLVVSFPYVEGAIEKVDYNISGESFNLILVPAGDSSKIDPKDVKFSYTGGKIDFIITVDIPNLNSLGTVYTENQSQFQSKNIINIDRHLINNNFGTVNLVNKQISSTSELVYQLIRDLGVELDKDIATNLYTGILAATNNFSSFSVNPQTFEAAATLMKHGAVKKQIPTGPKPGGFGMAPQPGSGAGLGGGFGLPSMNMPGMNMPGMNANPSKPGGYGNQSFGFPAPSPSPFGGYMGMPGGMNPQDDPLDDFDDEETMLMSPTPLPPVQQQPPQPGRPVHNPGNGIPQQQNQFGQSGQLPHREQPKQPPVTQQNATDQGKSPQDWLKPKLFRGDNVI